LSNRSHGGVFVRNATANEFAVELVRGVGKYGDSCRGSAMNEVGCFEESAWARIRRQDNHVGRPDRVIGDERPSSGPQNLSSRRNSDGARQYDHEEGKSPSRRASDHARHEHGKFVAPMFMCDVPQSQTRTKTRRR
jgi:hypothetical protein